LHKAGPYPIPPPSDSKDKKNDNTPETMKHLKFCLENGAFPMPARDNESTYPDASKPPSAGSGALWHVKGGTFQFRIACDFAISAAHVRIEEPKTTADVTENAAEKSTGKLDSSKDNAINSKAAADGTQPTPNGSLSKLDLTEGNAEEILDAENIKNVYGKPMQVTKPINSVLSIAIVSKEHGTLIPGFKASFVIKPVPTAAWAQYDPVHDPMASRDPQKLREYLFSAENVAVPLAMGVSLLSPDPVLALSPVPQFDVTAAAEAPVVGLSSTPNLLIWPLAKTEDAQSTRFFPESVNEAATQDDNTRAKQWDATRTRWINAFDVDFIGDGKDLVAGSHNGGTGLLGMCSRQLGWNVLEPAQEEEVARMDKEFPTMRKPWELRGALPKHLVEGQMSTDAEGKKERRGGLEEFYLALPQFCAVVA
jgi:hypothetical protein